LAQFCAAEEVAATNDDRYLNAVVNGLSDLGGGVIYDVGVNSDCPSPENLSGQLEKNAASHETRLSDQTFIAVVGSFEEKK